MNNNSYDLIIIGAGPAGLAASIYASRYKLHNMIVGKVLGGELSLAHKVCNFPGFEEISGLELAAKWKMQAEKLGASILLKEVQKIDKLPEGGFQILVGEKEKYLTKALIAATGSERRRLNIPGEKEYLGRGISYCHVCDGPFFKNKTVAVVGGSDAAVTGAVHLSEYANKVYLIYRGSELRAEPLWIDEWQRLTQSGKGQTILNTNLQQVLGNETKVTAVKLDKPLQGNNQLLLNGVFVEIGAVPGTALVQSAGTQIDASGHVLVDDTMATNIPGLFCAGDMTSKSATFKQATWAIGQGTRAAASVFKYIKKESAPQIRGI